MVSSGMTKWSDGIIAHHSQLLAQATPDTFPVNWHLRVAERHGEHARRVRRDVHDEG
jgi:LmbE family N-acetylglucosaminyl deacetylase